MQDSSSRESNIDSNGLSSIKRLLSMYDSKHTFKAWLGKVASSGPAEDRRGQTQKFETN